MFNYKKQKDFMLNFLQDILADSDCGTWKHSLRVGKLCRGIAGKMGLPLQECGNIAMAGFLHDVGKIYLTDIINHPGKLDSSEWELLCNHPQYGSEIITSSWQHIPKDINDGIVLHHERLDGSGYPFSLKEKDIPITARVVAVADVYDAMSNTRPYRPALADHVIMDELHRTGYDQAVVQALDDYLAVPQK